MQKLVEHDIRSRVAAEIKRYGVLSARAAAEEILDAHRDANLTVRELEDMIIEAAASAAVPVKRASNSSDTQEVTVSVSSAQGVAQVLSVSRAGRELCSTPDQEVVLELLAWLGVEDPPQLIVAARQAGTSVARCRC
jgi:hypothetical protein